MSSWGDNRGLTDCTLCRSSNFLRNAAGLLEPARNPLDIATSPFRILRYLTVSGHRPQNQTTYRPVCVASNDLSLRLGRGCFCCDSRRIRICQSSAGKLDSPRLREDVGRLEREDMNVLMQTSQT